MSAPTPAPGDDRPREGYYPDPSIPGYVRYWNGASWVPGTSRPAPSDGTPLAAPDGSGAGSAPVEETGPHFFDEDPAPQISQHGNRPEPASAWGADRSRQAGFGGDQDRRVSWGSPQGPDPRVAPAGGAGTAPTGGPVSGQPGEPVAGQPGGQMGGAMGGQSGGPAGGQPGAQSGGLAGGQPGGQAGGRPGAPAGAPTAHTDGTATVPPADTSSDIPSEGTFVFRRPTAGSGGAGGSAEGAGAPGAGGFARTGGPAGPGGAGGHGGSSGAGAASGAGRPAGGGPNIPAPGGPVGDDGTMTFRPMAPRAGAPGAPGFGAGKAAADRAAAQAGAGAGAGAGPAAASAALSGPQGPASAPTALSGPQGPAAPQQPAPGVPAQPSGPQPQPQPQPQSRPAQPAAAAAGQGSAAPMSSGSGGGQPSWAQQVHRLAGGEEQPVAPWKPPVEDVFQAAARRQSEARPAPLGKRLVARLLDTVVLAAVTAVAAVPLGTKAIDHVDEKIDAAKLSGETVTVWLLDGTTAVYLGIVLAVLLGFGVLYEALPTAKWGRTLGKKLLGLEVRDIEGHQPPGFGGAVRRWLVYSVPGVLLIGVVGVVWCLFDRPWRQCWHDKAAHTFVAG